MVLELEYEWLAVSSRNLDHLTNIKVYTVLHPQKNRFKKSIIDHFAKSNKIFFKPASVLKITSRVFVCTQAVSGAEAVQQATQRYTF